ncbi:MAG: HAD-IIA family hydrolase [Micropruina sp.]|nr:HAD-IIA family hydrolase [Micropruina sp.]
MSRLLIDDYDVAFFDLDGVIYLGPVAVDGALAAVTGVRSRGTRVIYVTNNASRSAQQVADHLSELGFVATPDDLVTSAQVAADILSRELPQGARILVAGSPNLVNLMTETGFVVVTSADEEPDAVIQGYDPQMTWPRLNEAAIAIQRGAVWYATNNDSTLPNDRGILPGLGAAINAVGNTVDIRPTVFGKPFRPMLDFALAKTGAERPIFVGDRIDTDIEGANNAGMASLFVFTGVHGKADLVAASAGARPSAIGSDVGALLQPHRSVTLSDGRAECGAAVALSSEGEVKIESLADDLPGQLDALWAIAQLAWTDPSLNTESALARLSDLR